MRTKILSMVLMFVVISGLSKSTYAAANADYTILNNIKAINKIEVRGNVELFISDNSTEQVKVYNKYYSESALVQSKNGTLRITSYTPEKLIVWVSAQDLRSVSAYDNAEVKSFGEIANIEFSVDLHDNASAKLNFNTFNADITVRDSAKIEIDGTLNELNLTHSVNSTVIKNDFTADHFSENEIPAKNLTRTDDLVGLE